eukprot:sb/3472346/
MTRIVNITACRTVIISGAWRQEVEPTETSKQPIRTRYLGLVTGYQPIRDKYFLIRSVPGNLKPYIYIYPASLNKPPVASSAAGALSINSQLGGGLFPAGWQFIFNSCVTFKVCENDQLLLKYRGNTNYNTYTLHWRVRVRTDCPCPKSCPSRTATFPTPDGLEKLLT